MIVYGTFPVFVYMLMRDVHLTQRILCINVQYNMQYNMQYLNFRSFVSGKKVRIIHG